MAWQIAVEEDKRLVPVAILQVGEENATELLALKTNLADKRTEQLLDDFAIAETPDFTNPIKFNIIIAVKSFFKRNYRDLAKASGKIVVSKE